MTSAPVDIVTPSRWNQPLPRKIALLLLIGLAWEIYGRVLDNALLFPTLLQTLRSLYEAVISGVLPQRAG